MFSRLSVLAFFILTLVLVASSFTTPLNAQDDSLQIVIDGQINDWQAAPPGIDDPQGDSQSDLDLKSARAFTQGDSFYLMIAFHTPPSDEAAIEVLVDVNGDQTPDYRLDLNDAIGQMDVIDLARPDATPVVPLRAQIAQDDALEFKTPLTALNNATNFSLTSIATADQADVMGPLGVPVVDETQPVTRIVIDGEPGDWEDYPTWAHDLQHDSHGALDLKTVKTFTNDRYWYVMIEAYDITGPYEILNIPIDMERGGDPEYWLGFNPRLGFIGIADQTDPGAHRAVEGAQVAEGSVIELKIPLSAVEDDTTFYIGAVQVLTETNPMAETTAGGLVPNRDELEEAAPLGQPLSVIAQTMDLRQMRGEEPTDIVISPDGSRLYVPARNTDTLYVIDAGTRQVTDVVNLWDEAQHPFGPTPSRVAISSDGRYVALANQVDYSFTILDTTTLEPVGTARPGGSDMAVDVAISGQTAFGLSGSGVLSLIDLPTATVTQTVNLGREVMAMAAAPDGSAIYVSLSRRGILVLDPATGQIVRTIDTSDKGGGSGDLIISPDGARIYASAPNEDMIIAVDLTTYQVISTYEALLPEGLALNGDGSRLFVGTFGVTGEARYNLWVLDTQSGALVQGINFTHPAPYGRLVSDIAGIATAPDGSTLYLATVDGDGVVVFNTDTLDAEGIILINPLAEALPTRAVISPDGAALYVSSRVKRPATVAVIDTATQAVVDEIVADSERECDSASYGLGISPDGQVLYILASDAMCIFPVDTATQTVGTPLHIDERGTLIHMAVHPDGDRAYVLSISGTVYVVGLPDLTLETTIPLGLEDTYTIKLTPDGTRAYVTDSLGYAVLDLNTNTVLNVQQGGERVSFQWVSGRAVGLHPMEPIVYIGDFWGFDVQRTDTDAVLYRLDLTQRGWSPGRTLTRDMAFTPDGRLGYLALWDEKGVLVFDPQSRQVKARIDTGRLPYNGCSPAWLVPAPDGQTMYAVNEECDSVTVIDTTSQQITAMISLNGAETRRYEIVPVPCMINAPNVVNLRAGPGTTFEVVRQLDPSEQVEADGQTTGTDGFIWWRLTEGAWVRSDVVEAGLGCDAMPTVTP